MRKMMFSIIVILTMTCCKIENNATPVLNQVILFQAEYVNYAWIYQHNGWLIDSSGYVRSYNLPKDSVFVDSSGYISSINMSKNIQRLDSVIGKINKDTLLKYFIKLQYAEKGVITKPITESYDGGVTKFSGYIYDSNSKEYKQVLIKQIGDVFIDNKSIEANEIYNWMINVNTRNQK
jgi:hypothetical protein